MSLSKQVRQENRDFALKLMVKDLGDGWIRSTNFTADGAEYEKVLPTTWKELVASGCLREQAFLNAPSRYRLTAYGYLTGARLLNKGSDPSLEGVKQIV